MPTPIDDPSSRRRPRRLFRASRAILLLAPLVVLTGCDQRFGLPRPATEQGEGVLDLWLFSLYVATALGVLVLGVLAYSMVRHRRRNNDLPKQTEGSVPWELTYTIIPFIIVGVLFFYGLQIQNDQTKLVKDPDIKIDVTGYRWNWQFDYKDANSDIEPTVATVLGTQADNAEMVLPVNKRVEFDLIAADVAHAFFVPQFLTKRDLIPGVHNVIQVTPDRTGNWVGHCAEMCGLNHSDMNFTVRVVSQEEYDAWLADQKKKTELRAAAELQKAATTQKPAETQKVEAHH